MTLKKQIQQHMEIDYSRWNDLVNRVNIGEVLLLLFIAGLFYRKSNKKVINKKQKKSE